MKNYLTFLVFIFLLSSCDSFLFLQGVIVDKDTGKPIENANVFVVYKDENEMTIDSMGVTSNDKTDKHGRFEVAMPWWPFPKREIPPLEVFVKAANYRDTIINVPHDHRELFELKRE